MEDCAPQQVDIVPDNKMLSPLQFKKEITPWYKEKNAIKLLIIGCLVLVFAIAELVVGIITGSLALLADAFHMLADEISLIIALWAIIVSKRARSATFSYGWIRAEVVGGLVNGVFLVTVVFFIILEALQRFLDIPEITQPVLIFVTGGGGLLVNIIALIVLKGEGHGHSHSHGSSHEHGATTTENTPEIVVSPSSPKRSIKTPPKSPKKSPKHGHSHKHKEEEEHSHSHDSHEDSIEEVGHSHKSSHKSEKESHSSHASHGSGGQLNMQGVFLHVLGDALGSVGAIASGLIIWLVPSPYRFYSDPILSIVIGLIILKPTIPLIKHCIKILMQSVPENVNLPDIQSAVMEIEGVKSVHELHVWQLSDTKLIGTVHLTCDLSQYNHFHEIAAKIKKVLHAHGIHSTTIQPEFVATDQEDEDCLLLCETTECQTNLCCDEEERQVLLSEKTNKMHRRKKEVVVLP